MFSIAKFWLQAAGQEEQNPETKASPNNPGQQEEEGAFDLNDPAGVAGLISKLFREKELKAANGSMKDFDLVVKAFTNWLQASKPRKTSLAQYFRAVSLNKGDFNSAKHRRSASAL